MPKPQPPGKILVSGMEEETWTGIGELISFEQPGSPGTLAMNPHCKTVITGLPEQYSMCTRTGVSGVLAVALSLSKAGHDQ